MDEGSVLGEQSHRVDDRHDGARPRPARRTIHFRVGEDRDVSQIRAVVGRRRRENRAVDAGQSRLERMRNRLRGLDRFFDGHADAAKLGQVRCVDRQADRLAVDDRVERAAECDVGANRARPEPDDHPGMQHE